MNKKGLGLLLIVLGVLGGVYLFVLVGIFGALGLGGGLIYAGYKLYTAKNFQLISDKIELNKKSNTLYLEVCVKNLSNKPGEIFVTANIYNKGQLIMTVTTNTLTVMPQGLGKLKAEIDVNIEEINPENITHEIIGSSIK